MGHWRGLGRVNQETGFLGMLLVGFSGRKWRALYGRPAVGATGLRVAWSGAEPASEQAMLPSTPDPPTPRAQSVFGSGNWHFLRRRDGETEGRRCHAPITAGGCQGCSAYLHIWQQHRGRWIPHQRSAASNEPRREHGTLAHMVPLAQAELTDFSDHRRQLPEQWQQRLQPRKGGIEGCGCEL